MGTLGARTSLAHLLAALVACGDNAAAPDAAVPDAAPDAPSLDLSCVGRPLPATAPAAITASGSVQEVMQQGAAPVDGATIATFPAGAAAPIDTATSAADGSFTTGSLPTGGVPFEGYLRATKDDPANPFRASFVFASAPFAADTSGVPVTMFRALLFELIGSFVARVTQDDSANGALLVVVTDCANKPIPEATPIIRQGGAPAGTLFALAQTSPQAAGIYLVFNVPAGEVTVSATYGSMTFPAHRVISFKNEGAVTSGALSLTAVRPGPP